MSHNLAARPREERDRINVDLAAAGVMYKERLNLPVNAAEVGRQQSEALREYYRERRPCISKGS
ncbi:MAG: DNA polymerase III subunit theta [Pantoea sp. Morm]|uniref:DNA polymerase III subunit theta n=1 Tax=Pantoea sp. Morm TaxID=2601250 RepID=UPI001D3A96EB|nr:DNA polymerase III subunit theta [Pantoea sp. Morm]